MRNCDLFIAIRKALNLSDDTSKGFRDRDLETLDVTTIVTALEVFKDNMTKQDKDGAPNYKNFEHFGKKDPNFLSNLQKIIEYHKKRGEATLKQFKAINFIQSVAKAVEVERLRVEVELVKWSATLANEHKDFSKLTLGAIREHVLANIKGS